MAKSWGATVMPPDTSARQGTAAPPADDRRVGGNGDRGSRSPLDGLKALATHRSRGGGGGGPGGRRPKSGSGGIDIRNTWQILAGSILIPLGVVFILMAWYGAAHTAYVQQQIPYLVSGSFAGLGCLVVGGLFYWAHWLYRLYDQADLHHEEHLRAMEQMVRALVHGGAGGSATGELAGPAGSGQVPGAFGRPDGDGYVVTATGAVYHRPSCPIVAHHAQGLRTVGPGDLAALEACRICLPTGR